MQRVAFPGDDLGRRAAESGDLRDTEARALGRLRTEAHELRAFAEAERDTALKLDLSGGAEAQHGNSGRLRTAAASEDGLIEPLGASRGHRFLEAPARLHDRFYALEHPRRRFVGRDCTKHAEQRAREYAMRHAGF